MRVKLSKNGFPSFVSLLVPKIELKIEARITSYLPGKRKLIKMYLADTS